MPKAADKTGLSGDAYWADAMAIYKKKPNQEVASATVFPNVTRAGSKISDPFPKKESQSGSFSIRCRFKESESGTDESGQRFNVILLQEGLGNLKDCYYYTGDCIKTAPGIFEGKKIYADHPDQIQEQTRPERSVKDILGHFENVHVEEADDGRAMLCADVVILPGEPFDWARSLMKHSVEYAKQYPEMDFVGLSINASGDADDIPLEQFMKTQNLSDSILPKLQQALAEGITEIKPVSAITEAVSADLVTEAGAGGKIRKMIEQEKKSMIKKEKEKKEAMEIGDDKKDPAKLAPQAKQVEAMEMEDGDDADVDVDTDHADAEQDKALIAQMIKKHLGDDSDNEEVSQKCNEAIEAYKEMGYGKKEAVEAAMHSMKLAKHMAAKQCQAAEAGEAEAEAEAECKQAEGAEAEAEAECKQAEGDTDGPLGGATDVSKDVDNSKGPKKPMKDMKPIVGKLGKEKPEEMEAESNVGGWDKGGKIDNKGGVKESNSKIIALTAENARLKEALKKHELEKLLDKTLRESRLPMDVTKKFRECLGTPKSEKEISEKFKVFKEAYSIGSESEGMGGFIYSVEKQEYNNSAETSLADCAEKE